MRSAFSGNHCTHVYAREDAVIHNGREYVPTVWGQEEGNTVYVSNMQEFLAAGGKICFNEDQTEIHLVLPVGHKFGITFYHDLK
jgi:hypothetical protein